MTKYSGLKLKFPKAVNSKGFTYSVTFQYTLGGISSYFKDKHLENKAFLKKGNFLITPIIKVPNYVEDVIYEVFFKKKSIMKAFATPNENVNNYEIRNVKTTSASSQADKDNTKNVVIGKEKLDINKVFESIIGHEGDIKYMYLDTAKPKSKVTIGYGKMLPSAEYAATIPFLIDGKSASANQIKQDWYTVYNSVSGINSYSASHFKEMTKVRITKETAKKLTLNHIKKNISDLRRIFPDFDSYPIPAQEAMLDMVYNLGIKGKNIKSFPTLSKHIKDRNFVGAARESNRPQLSPTRNKHVKDLFLKAAEQEKE